MLRPTRPLYATSPRATWHWYRWADYCGGARRQFELGAAIQGFHQQEVVTPCNVYGAPGWECGCIPQTLVVPPFGV